MRRDLALGKVGAVKLVGLLLALSTAAMVIAQHSRSGSPSRDPFASSIEVWTPLVSEDALNGVIRDEVAAFSVPGNPSGSFSVTSFCERGLGLAFYIRPNPQTPAIARNYRSCTTTRVQVGSGDDTEMDSCRPDDIVALVFSPDMKQQQRYGEQARRISI
jgi:hypothetical protein